MKPRKDDPKFMLQARMALLSKFAQEPGKVTRKMLKQEKQRCWRAAYKTWWMRDLREKAERQARKARKEAERKARKEAERQATEEAERQAKRDAVQDAKPVTTKLLGFKHADKRAKRKGERVK